MVGVKKVIADNVDIVDVVRDLLREYRSVKVNMKGSPLHKKARLSKDQSLVSAWNRRKEAGKP